MVDQELETRLGSTDDEEKQERLRSLLGKVAIANARVTYQAFKRMFSGPRWEALATKGGNVQRPLWASTGTKNRAYSDTLYVTDLIGAHTVNTLPESTLLLFADHGVVRGDTIEEDIEGAQQVMRDLAETGIDLQDITENRLVTEGVRSFVDSFDKLIAVLRKKRDAVVGDEQPAPVA
jgi:transaldolase/glucose-6-phosphate isomerase